MFLFSSLASFGADADLSPVRRRRHAMQVFEIAHEVSVGSDPDFFQNLFDGEERCAQHLLGLSQAKIFEILGRTGSGFLLEEMAKARRREVHEGG